MVSERMLDSFTSSEKFFGADALGINDNESQKGVKNLIQKAFTNLTNRKILTSESDSKYTFIRLSIGHGYVLNFMGESTNIRTYCIRLSYFFLKYLKYYPYEPASQFLLVKEYSNNGFKLEILKCIIQNRAFIFFIKFYVDQRTIIYTFIFIVLAILQRKTRQSPKFLLKIRLIFLIAREDEERLRAGGEGDDRE